MKTVDGPRGGGAHDGYTGFRRYRANNGQGSQGCPRTAHSTRKSAGIEQNLVFGRHPRGLRAVGARAWPISARIRDPWRPKSCCPFNSAPATFFSSSLLLLLPSPPTLPSLLLPESVESVSFPPALRFTTIGTATRRASRLAEPALAERRNTRLFLARHSPLLCLTSVGPTLVSTRNIRNILSRASAGRAGCAPKFALPG